jgi:hypothetical protein
VTLTKTSGIKAHFSIWCQALYSEFLYIKKFEKRDCNRNLNRIPWLEIKYMVYLIKLIGDYMNVGTFTGKAWGAVVDVIIHAPAQKVRLKDETAKVASDNNASSDAVAVLAERIPATHAKALYNAGQNIRNHIDRRSVTINGQKVVPVAILPSLWVELFGHDTLTSTECIGHTGLVCKYEAHKSGLIQLCESGELDRIVAEKAGNLLGQISKVDCGLIRSSFGVDIKLDIDCDSQIVRDALAQLSENVRSQVEAKAKADAEKASGEAVVEVTQYALNWVQDTLNNVIAKVSAAEKGTQYKRLVDSVRELVDRLPSYNLTGNKQVADAISNVREKLAKLMNADSLRDDKATRDATVDAAKAILDDLLGNG